MDVFRQIFDWLGNALNDVLGWVLWALPDSPFKLIEKTPIGPYLPYINWFIPVDFILSTLSAWVSVISIYYGYQCLLRWIKSID